MLPSYDNPPSRAQLRYLKNLGYLEPAPLSMAEASAAIDEMLDTGDPAAAYREILLERRERESLFGGVLSPDAESQFRTYGTEIRTRRPPSRVWWLLAAPFLAFAYSVSAVFWILSRLIALLGWIILRVAGGIIWVFSRIGVLADRSAAAAVQTGREKVIPWIGAQDWRRMAAGCSAQFVAASRRVDGLLSGASGDDRALHHILRFATVAAVAIVLLAGLLFAVG